MKKRICAFSLAFIMIVSLLPANIFAFAASAVARVDGSKTYTNFSDAWSAAAKSGTHTLELLNDVTVSKCLEVGAGCRLTIKMNYWAFLGTHAKKSDPNGASDSGGDGSLFHIDTNASVTIVGGDLNADNVKERRGTLVSNVWFPDVNGSKIIKGALICGGGTDSADGGGAFRIEEKGRLILQNVTVAGNIAAKYLKMFGSGGAIKILGDEAYLSLENSSIIYNYAERDGGGVYIDGEDCTILLRNSHIDYNKAGTDGGAIFASEDVCAISLYNSTLNGNRAGSDGGAICYALFADVKHELALDETSTINSNTAGDEGGALYVGGEKLTVNGGTFSGNTAKIGGAIFDNNDADVISNATFTNNYAIQNGGAIYLGETGCIIRNCKIISNQADKGGGVYLEEEDNTIEGSTIERNMARTSGGGVYAPDTNLVYTMKLGLSGTVIIRDNVVKGEPSNLVLDEKTYIVGCPSVYSEIHVTCGERRLSYEPATFCEAAFVCDDSSKYVKWVNDPADANYRQLMVVKGPKPEGLPKVELTPEETAPVATDLTYKVTNSDSSLAGTYSIVKGFARGETESALNLYYYTDGYFFNDPFQYDTHLATMSIVLEMSAFNATYDVDSLGNSIGYTNRFRGVKQLLADIGCNDAKTLISDSFTVKPGVDTIGFAIGQKALKNAAGQDTGYTLVPIVIRGQGYEAEWASNVKLGTSGEAAGFKSAAEQVFSAVKAYIENYGLSEKLAEGKIRFWVVGYSRAGATANLTSKRLIDAYQNSGNAIYGYTFEAPQGGVASELRSDVNYTSIHNTINYSDFVPYVAPVDMDFMRYGVDHYVPGSPAGNVVSFNRNYAGSMTGAADENALDVTGKNSTARYYKDNIWYDTLTVLYSRQRPLVIKQLQACSETMQFDDYFHLGEINLVSSIGPWYKVIDENGSDSVTMAVFLQDFFHYFQRWGIGAYSRKTYSTELESDIARLVAYIMTMTDEQINNVINRLPLITEDMPEVIGMAIADYSLNGTYFDNPETIIFLRTLLSGALILSKEAIDPDVVTDNLLHLVLRILTADYHNDADEYVDGTIASYDEDNNLMLLGTFIYNISNIVLNHQPILNYAWLRSYDSFYTDDPTATSTLYTVAQAAQREVKAPTASVNGETHINGIEPYYGETTLVLDMDDANRGGAIHYTVYMNGKVYGAPLSLYNAEEGIKLSPSTTGEIAKYTVVAHTMYFDTPSEDISVTLHVQANTPHKVTVNDELYGTYEVNQTVVVEGNRDDLDFVKWTLPKGTKLSFGSVDDPVIGFTMPFSDVALTAEYKQKQVKKPVADISGGLFNDNASIHFSTETEGAKIFYYVTRTVEGVEGSTQVTVTDDTLNLVAEKNKKITYNVTAHAVKNGMLDSEILQTTYVVDKKSKTFKITIHATDNANWSRDYTLSAEDGDTVTIEAPYVQDEMFMEWLSTSSIKLSDADKKSSALNVKVTKDITLYVRYAPVVNAIEMTIQKPVAGRPLSEKAENAKITVTNVYSLDDFGVSLRINWSPASRTANYETTYTAMIPIDQVKEYDFAIGKNLAIKINNGTVTGSLVQGSNGAELWCTFPKTEVIRLTGIVSPDSITLPHGVTKEEVKSALPEYIQLSFSNGSRALAPVTWNTFNYSETEFSEQNFTVSGNIDLSGTNNPNKISGSVSINVTVLQAEKTAAPTADIQSGSFDSEQQVTLSCETEGAKIYYTLDGTEPTASATLYTGKITIPGGAAGELSETILRAIAVADKMEPSTVTSYTYIITLPAPDPTPTVEPVATPTGAPENPTTAPEKPTETPENPTKTPENPTETPENPTEAPENPTEAPENPTEAPVSPTDEPEIPTGTPTDVPTSAPENPTATPEIPTVAPGTPTEAPRDLTEAPTATPIITNVPEGKGHGNTVFLIVAGSIAGVGAITGGLWFLFKKKGWKLPGKSRKKK